ncbi:hypothetical protein [Nocardia salmonicida]|uniref:hypothetical protein n=1 Tax=Nocardia salmonicida TaxID=53431 RepID=UPI003628C28C
MTRRIRRNRVLREALTARKRLFLERWPTRNGTLALAALESGGEYVTDSDELFSALHQVGLEAEAMRYAYVNGPTKTFILGRDDVLTLAPDDEHHDRKALR